MVNIKGIIGNEEGEVNLLSVIDQVQAESTNEIHVLIDSIGGDVDEGVSIYEYLRSLDKKVTTESVNNCASIAAIIFLAGEVRIAGCPIMIHNPYIDGITGDQKMLEMAAEWVGEKERQYEKICAERTKLSAETLSVLMDNETYLSPSQAKSFGFATQDKIIALAKLNKSNINKNSKQMSKEKKSIWDRLPVLQMLAKAGGKIKAMDLTDATGNTLTVEREEGEPQVGDTASPDGSFTMPDGKIIIVSGGVITEITEPEAKGLSMTDEEAEEIVAVIAEVAGENEGLRAENDNLKEQIASAKAKAKSDEDIAMLNAIAKAGGNEWLAKQCSHYKPQARTGVKGKNEVQRSNPLIDKINKLKGEGGK